MSLLLGNLRDLLGDLPDDAWRCPAPDIEPFSDHVRGGDRVDGSAGPAVRHESPPTVG